VLCSSIPIELTAWIRGHLVLHELLSVPRLKTNHVSLIVLEVEVVNGFEEEFR